jgi:hypothetical protein
VKRQVFFHPRFIGSIEDCGFGEMTLPLCTFGRQQVSTTRLATQDFAGRGYLKAFCHRFFRFASRYRFWHREPGTYTLEPGTQQETTLNVSKPSRVGPPVSTFQESMDVGRLKSSARRVVPRRRAEKFIPGLNGAKIRRIQDVFIAPKGAADLVVRFSREVSLGRDGVFGPTGQRNKLNS